MCPPSPPAVSNNHNPYEAPVAIRKSSHLQPATSKTSVQSTDLRALVFQGLSDATQRFLLQVQQDVYVRKPQTAPTVPNTRVTARRSSEGMSSASAGSERRHVEVRETEGSNGVTNRNSTKWATTTTRTSGPTSAGRSSVQQVRPSSAPAQRRQRTKALPVGNTTPSQQIQRSRGLSPANCHVSVSTERSSLRQRHRQRQLLEAQGYAREHVVKVLDRIDALSPAKKASITSSESDYLQFIAAQTILPYDTHSGRLSARALPSFHMTAQKRAQQRCVQLMGSPWVGNQLTYSLLLSKPVGRDADQVAQAFADALSDVEYISSDQESSGRVRSASQAIVEPHDLAE